MRYLFARPAIATDIANGYHDRMDLLTYISDQERRRALAKAVNTKPEYLWQMATGWKKKRASPEMAVAIHKATDGLVSCRDMRNDLSWTHHPDGSISYSVTIPAPAQSSEAA